MRKNLFKVTSVVMMFCLMISLSFMNSVLAADNNERLVNQSKALDCADKLEAEIYGNDELENYIIIYQK